MADNTVTSRYVKLTKDQDAPVEEIRPGELNQPVRVPQLAVHRCSECGQPLPESYSPPADEPWTTGICGCAQDTESCWTGLFCPCVLFGRNVERLREDIPWTRPCVCHAIFVEGGMALAAATALFHGIDPGTPFLIGEGLLFTWWMCGIYTGLFRQSLQKKYHLKVIEAAKGRPEILVHVGLEYRYMPPVAKLIEVVKSGRIGEVKMVAIREHRFPFLVKVNNWNRFNANTGGTLVEKCCHFFDLMRLFAVSNPVRVMASGSNDVNHKDEIYDGKVPDIIDSAYVIIEFDNGTRGMLDLCMFAEGSKNEQEISVVGDIGKGEAFVPESIVRVGTRTGGRAGVQTLHAVDERIKYDGLHHGSSYLEHLTFLSAVRAQESGNAAPAVDLHDGLLSVAMGVAGQLSIEQGRFVTIDEVLSGPT